MVLLIFLIWFPISTILSGLSGAVFWNWFIAGPGAAFHGSAPTITAIQALGIALVVRFLTFQFTSDSDDKDGGEVVLEGIFKGIAFFILFWVMAIIYHAFM